MVFDDFLEAAAVAYAHRQTTYTHTKKRCRAAVREVGPGEVQAVK